MKHASSTPITERFMTCGGIRTRVLEVSGQGPTVVLIHGFTDSADCWRPVLEALASRGRNALAVDLPGHGRADRPRILSLSVLDPFMTDLVVRCATSGPVVLVGNSLGGYLALRTASHGGLPLGSVATLGTAGLAYRPAFQLFVSTIRFLHPALRLIDPLPIPPFLARWLATSTYKRLTAGRVDPSLTRAYADHFDGAHALARVRRYLVAMSKEIDAHPLSLHNITVPVLLAWGRRDSLTDPAGADALIDAVPGSQLVLLRDAGHCPQLELPDEVARLVASFPGTPARVNSES